MNKFLVLFISAFLSMKTFAQEPVIVQTVQNVDLTKYSGLWYEIASFPQRFQKGCKCTTAEYQILGNDKIKVINKCIKPDKKSKIEGKAFVVPNTGNSKLKIQFFWPFKSDYWIIELDENYKWAAVGNSDQKNLWILSRTPEMSIELYKNICEKLSKKGYNTENLQRTIQDCK